VQGQEQEQEGGFKARAANQVDAERHRATPVQEEERSGGVGGVVGGGKETAQSSAEAPWVLCIYAGHWHNTAYCLYYTEFLHSVSRSLFIPIMTVTCVCEQACARAYVHVSKLANKLYLSLFHFFRLVRDQWLLRCDSSSTMHNVY